MSIHTRIREGRRLLKMTEQQFADQVGVTRGAVQQWEKEGGTAPKRAHQKKVADLINMSVAQLMGQNETAPITPLIARSGQEPIYHQPLTDIISRLATYLAQMDPSTQQLAGSLLRDLAHNPSNHLAVAAALQAIADQANQKAA